MNSSLQMSAPNVYAYNNVKFDFSQVHDDAQRARMISAVDRGLTISRFGRVDENGLAGTGQDSPGLKNVVAGLMGDGSSSRTIRFYDNKEQMINEAGIPKNSADNANGLTNKQGGDLIWVAAQGSSRAEDPDDIFRSTYPQILNDTWHELTHASGVERHDANPSSSESTRFRQLEQKIGMELSPVTNDGSVPTVTDPVSGKEYTISPENFTSNDALGENDGKVMLFAVDASKPIMALNEEVSVASGVGQTEIDGDGDFISVDGEVTANGGGNTITGTNGSQITLENTGAAIDSVTGNDLNIAAAQDVSVNVFGSSNLIVLTGPDDTVGAYGGGNTIYAGAGDAVVIGQTGTSIDTVNAIGDAGGGITIHGNGTGIFLNPDASANVLGGSNLIVLTGPDDTVGAYGGGNTIYAGAGDAVVIASTGSSFDTVFATGDSVGGFTLNGNRTGIVLSNDAQVNLYGNNDIIALGTGDSLGAYGGGNTINTQRGDLVVVGNTNGNFDTVNGNGDIAGGFTANGQGTGIGLANDAQVNLNGSNNTVSLGTGDSLGAYGGGNTINTQGGDLVVVGNTNGNFDTVNGNGDVGGGFTANGQATGIGLNNDAQINLYGGNNTVSLGTGDSLGAYGGGNTINTQGGDLVVVGNTNGNFDTVNGNGDIAGGFTANGQGTGIGLANDAQVNLNGSNNTVSLGTGDSLGAYGGGNTINTQRGDLVVVGNTNGNFDTVNGNGDIAGGFTANGQGTGIGLANDAQVNLNGSNNTVSLGTGDSLGAYGGGNTINTQGGDLVVVGNTNGNFDAVNGNGDIAGGLTANGQGTGIALADDAQANVNGSNDTVSLAARDTVGVYGGGSNTIFANDGSDVVWVGGNGVANGDVVFANSDPNLVVTPGGAVTVVGSSDTVFGQGTSDTVGFSGTNETFIGDHDTVNLNGAGYSVTINGSFDTANTFFSNDTIVQNGSYDTSNAINGVSGEGFVFNGSLEHANASNSTIELEGDYQSVTVTGSGDTGVSHANYDTLAFRGTSETAVITNGAVNLEGNNESVTIIGNSDAENSGGFTGDVVQINGNGDTANLSNGTVLLGIDHVAVGVQGSYDNIDYGRYDQIHVVGSHDNVSGGSYNAVDVTGTYDVTYDPYSTEKYFGDHTGDITNNDTDPSASVESGSSDWYNFDDFGDDFYGEFDFVQGASQSQIQNAPSVVLKDAVDSAALKLLETSAADNGVSAAEASAGLVTTPEPAFNGAAWHDRTVTWAFSPGQDHLGGLAFSSAMGLQDQSVVKQAMQTWSGVLGLNLVETTNVADANIQVGWGNFDTASSGVLGYTNYAVSKGGSFAGAEIRIEDPTETSFITDQNGREAYAGTNAELYQVALHEIGHALGLADNSDLHSVMYYGSGSSNQTLDATDITNIRSLYSQPAASISEMAPTAGVGTANDASSLVAPSTTPQQLLQHAA